MCNEFLNFFDEKTQDWPMHLDISYSKMCDWTILVTKRGCAKGYPECVCDGDDVVLVNVQDPDKEFCFAKAYVELKEWFLKYKGGY